MEFLNITIDGKRYDYVTSINYNSKSYVALANADVITISEYDIVDGKLILYQISDDVFKSVSEVMCLNDKV